MDKDECQGHCCCFGDLNFLTCNTIFIESMKPILQTANLTVSKFVYLPNLAIWPEILSRPIFVNTYLRHHNDLRYVCTREQISNNTYNLTCVSLRLPKKTIIRRIPSKRETRSGPKGRMGKRGGCI